jgi:hypothetical protein
MSRSISPKTSTRAASGAIVASTSAGWAVRHAGGREIGVFATQAEATDAARSALRKSGGAVRVQGPDGRVHETLTLGRDAMARIAAVEGISLPGDLERLLGDLDRAGASSEERRRAVALQFGQKR